MKHKHHILTQDVYKWKVQLCLDGSCQVFGQDYDKSYAPVADGIITPFVLILAIINGQDSLQIDYIMAYIQAPVEHNMYMEIPRDVRWMPREIMSCRSIRTFMVKSKLATSGSCTWSRSSRALASSSWPPAHASLSGRTASMFFTPMTPSSLAHNEPSCWRW